MTWLSRDVDSLTGAGQVDDLAAATGDHFHQQGRIEGFLEQAREAVGGDAHEPLLELAAELGQQAAPVNARSSGLVQGTPVTASAIISVLEVPSFTDLMFTI